ncbi:putative tyrosinase [Nostoc sp. NIES-4103]|nr:putative tyrosinase [Nostoc sp. NIES-4103]
MKKFLIALMLAIFTTIGTLLLPSIAYAQSSQVPQPTPSTPSTPLNKRYPKPKTSKAVYTRYSINTPEGQKALKSLEAAFKILRDNGCEDPSSWYYQGAIHWVPNFSNFQNQNTVCQKYTQAAFDDPQQKAEVEKLIAAWQHCTHFGGEENPPPHSPLTAEYDLHFLPWHRLYIGYLEKIVRKLSGDQNFAIPYWEYTNPNQTTIATDFVTPSSSLYTNLRRSSLNRVDGKVDSIQQQRIEKDKKTAYKSTTFNNAADPNNSNDFTNLIDRSPHGAMHVYIGGDVGQAYNPVWQGASPSNSGLMRDVFTAGFDPIFWVHHSTIDRYWESWTQATKIKATPQDLPLPQELAPLYTFVDENGNLVKFNSPQEIIDAVYNVDYKYDKLDPDSQTLFKQPLRTITGIRTSPTVTVVGAKKNGDSLNELTKITVPLTKSLEATPALPGASLRSESEPNQPNISAKAPLAGGQYVLDVTVSFSKRPIGNYSVYLNLPHAKTVTEIIGDIDNYYIGAANFFDAHSTDGGTKTFAFDVTNELNAQWSELKKGTVEDFDVYFISDNPSQTNDIKVESLTLRNIA